MGDLIACRALGRSAAVVACRVTGPSTAMPLLPRLRCRPAARPAPTRDRHALRDGATGRRDRMAASRRSGAMVACRATGPTIAMPPPAPARPRCRCRRPEAGHPTRLALTCPQLMGAPPGGLMLPDTEGVLSQVTRAVHASLVAGDPFRVRFAVATRRSPCPPVRVVDRPSLAAHSYWRAASPWRLLHGGVLRCIDSTVWPVRLVGHWAAPFSGAVTTGDLARELTDIPAVGKNHFFPTSPLGFRKTQEPDYVRAANWDAHSVLG